MTIDNLNGSNINTNKKKHYFGIDASNQQMGYSNINSFQELELETRNISFNHLDLIGKIDKLDNPKEQNNSIYLYSILTNNIEHLLYLELSCNRLPYNYIEHISQFLIDTPKLLHLDISSSTIDDNSLEILLDAITKNKSLIKLDISGISISTNIARYLSKLLGNQNTIQYYNLYNIFTSMDSFSVCFDKLVISSSIHTLLLGNNKIDDNHIPLLLNSLKNNKSLTFLDLILNRITYKSINNIRDWLIPIKLTFDSLFDGSYQVNRNKLCNLDLTNNYLDSCSYPTILDIVNNNINLNIFNFDYGISIKNNIIEKLNRNKKCILNIIVPKTKNDAIIASLYNILSIDIIEKLLFAIRYLEILYIKSI